MAIHANSTRTLERRLLPSGQTRIELLLPTIPHQLCPEAEFLLLMDLKRRTEERLDELVETIDPGVPHLPISGLQGVSPDVLLFKGGLRFEAR